MSLTSILILIVVVLAIIIALAAWWWEKATREVALIRTGLGGRKVITDGGVLALPWFTEVAKVNMQTLRLEVSRRGESALITHDRLRVDVGVEFYVSVASDPEAIARAGQTLGDRTFDPDRLRDLIEGKLVDTLRAVAAQMTMDELHENRGTFVQEVRDMLGESLAANGLALESVSLTALDQTPFSALDENNAFNAVGMRKLAEVIATSKKERATIERDAEVSVHRSAMEASKRRLEIDLEREEAEIRQVEALESLRARQIAEIAERKADSERAAAGARIAMEQAIRAADIEREKAIKEAEIAQGEAVEIAEQKRVIAIAEMTEAESRARASADAAKTDAVKAAEALVTAQAEASAERSRLLRSVAAREEAEAAGILKQLAAASDAAAAGDAAQAKLTLAKAEAEAEEIRIGTLEKDMAVRAKGQLALNEAENVFSAEIVNLKADIARLEALPKIIAEMVKPAEKIDQIRIHQIGGLGARGGGGGGGEGEAAAKPPVNQALDSIMDMAVQLPALKKIGEELGLSIEDGIEGVADPRRKTGTPKTAE